MNPKNPKDPKSKLRPKVSDKKAADLFIACRRVCALCWGLERDGRYKEGQIAHIDRNAHNNDPLNLCFLCLFHHNRYDTTMNQSKNFTKRELLHHKNEVLALVAEGRLPSLGTGEPSALLNVEIVESTLYGLGEKNCPGLEIRVVCSNQGTQATGIKSVNLSSAGQVIGKLVLYPKPSTEWSRPEAEVFYLAPSQIVRAGQTASWVMRFNLQKESVLVHKYRKLATSNSWPKVELSSSLELTVEPVIGSAVLILTDEILLTRMNLEEIGQEENNYNRAETQTWEDWHYERRKGDEIRTATRWPFPNIKGCLTPSVFYRP